MAMVKGKSKEAHLIDWTEVHQLKKKKKEEGEGEDVQK